MYRLENLWVYISDTGNHSDVEDEDNCGDGELYMTSTNGYTDTIWNNGVEVWCSKSGRYVHFYADYRDKPNLEYNISICSLGIIGSVSTDYTYEFVPQIYPTIFVPTGAE